ncbi:mycofactocin system transcriptional regulator [Gordonia aurantiaca]|uniref:mycofactocin system transcriptional regulator n=1 Tax=Gordonia sp. B21 TaxID=3151852 RepID=UPI003263287B
MTTNKADAGPQRNPPGRRPASSRARISAVAINLFTTRGFDETSVDDIAEAAGIARRTLFRYYSSKNELPWGEFDSHLDELRALLAEIPDDTPMADALVEALVSFNRVPPEEIDNHRRRMSLLLGVPALQAHSMIMYADWRQVVAEFAAARLGLRPDDPLPQTVGWLALGAALAAYEQWLAHPERDLEELIETGARTMADGVAALTRDVRGDDAIA